ncbi:MAG: hypothetical protein HZB32_00640 [Nitrospirae bacterium]|nr:hypothetical protein [Nitrospirota bacterium]
MAFQGLGSFLPTQSLFGVASPVPGAAQAATTPLQLGVRVARIEINRGVGPLTLFFVDTEGEQRGDAHGLYKRPLPPVFSITTSGRVVVVNGDAFSPYTVIDHRALPQSKRVDTISVSISRASAEARGEVSEFAQLTGDGEFSQFTDVVLDTSLPPPRALILTVNGTSATGSVVVSKRFLIELVDLEGFTRLIEAKERKQPGKTPLLFLSSVRKLYQGREGEPRILFNLAIGRHDTVEPLSKKDSAEFRRLEQYEQLYFEGTQIDIGHVLVGIEAAARQDPQPRGPIPRPDIFLTWGGDLGSALQEYIIARFFFPTTLMGTIEHYLIDRHAKREDLIGDIDGVNLGAIYDSSLSTAENLRTYYGKQNRRRFQFFLANTKNDDGTPALPLKPNSKPSRLTKPAHDFIAKNVVSFAEFVLTVKLSMYASTKKIPNKPLPATVQDMLKVSSPEVTLITNYFVSFLEIGLAAEAS